MMHHATPYGFGTVVSRPYAEAVESVRDALSREGFGVVSEIDMAATLRRKLGVETRPYVILGACMPALAYQALEVEPDVGLLLPCNVVVYATDYPERTAVVALDPEAALGLSGNPALVPVAAEVTARLKRALAAVEPDTTAAHHAAPLVDVAEEIR